MYNSELTPQMNEKLESYKNKINNVLKAFQDDNKKANILLCGKSGVGKSTLVNAVFGEKVAKTGVGRPVTQSTCVYENPPNPLRIYDTFRPV